MTYRQLYLHAKHLLPDYEARALLEDCFGMDRTGLALHGEESPDHAEAFLTALQKRAEGLPLQYVSGKAFFMDRWYAVGEGVLIPRDDTEVAVRECMRGLKGNETVIDLCAGSGIIAVTLAKAFPQLQVYALEKENIPYHYLLQNIRQHRANVIPVQGDVFSPSFADGMFDVIVSNPPYIRTGLLPSLQSEVQYEPKTALDGGEDGLQFYHCIAQQWLPKLRQGGRIVLEIGEEQACDISALLQAHGITQMGIVKDIQGLDRVIFGTKTIE